MTTHISSLPATNIMEHTHPNGTLDPIHQKEGDDTSSSYPNSAPMNSSSQVIGPSRVDTAAPLFKSTKLYPEQIIDHHPTLEEDHTIVIDLTEDRFNYNRDYDEGWCQITDHDHRPTAAAADDDDEAYPNESQINGEEEEEDKLELRSQNEHLVHQIQEIYLSANEKVSRMALTSSAESNHLSFSKPEKKSVSSPNQVLNNYDKASAKAKEEEGGDDESDKKHHQVSIPEPMPMLTTNPQTRGEDDVRRGRSRDVRRPRQLNLVKSLSQDRHTSSATTTSITTVVPKSSINDISRSKSLKRMDDKSGNNSHSGRSVTSLSLFDPAFSTPSLVNNDSVTSIDASIRTRLVPLESDGYRSLDRRLLIHNEAGRRSGARHSHRSIKTRKSQSSDYLDRLDNSISSSKDPNRHQTGKLQKQKQIRSTSKMNKIEKGLYLGNMEAATDVILLESHAITHIVTLDTVPLPRKMSSFLPRIVNIHFQMTDLLHEDLLSCIDPAVEFISSAQHAEENNVLVHCLRGKSRSAALVIAYLMQKYQYSLEKALKKVKSKRDCIKPHEGFLAQLKLFESMDYSLDSSNVQFKMFKQHLASERMRKAKILFREHLERVLDDDPGVVSSAKSHYSVLYKCKRCRRNLATSHNLMPHVKGETPTWTDPKWSLPSEEVLEGANDLGLDLCSHSLFVNPIRWMQNEIKQNLHGRLFCPNCQTRVGEYSWIKGIECLGCKVFIQPSFQLDVTEIIFKTKNRYLQSSGREPVLV